MATSIVVGRILLASYPLFGMEQLTVGSCSDLIDNSWLGINNYGTRHMPASSSLAEERAKPFVLFEAMQLPAGIAHLCACLANMNTYKYIHAEKNYSRNGLRMYVEQTEHL